VGGLKWTASSLAGKGFNYLLCSFSATWSTYKSFNCRSTFRFPYRWPTPFLFFFCQSKQINFTQGGNRQNIFDKKFVLPKTQHTRWCNHRAGGVGWCPISRHWLPLLTSTCHPSNNQWATCCSVLLSLGELLRRPPTWLTDATKVSSGGFEDSACVGIGFATGFRPSSRISGGIQWQRLLPAPIAF